MVGSCFSQMCFATTRKLFEAIVVPSTCWSRGYGLPVCTSSVYLSTTFMSGFRIRAQYALVGSSFVVTSIRIVKATSSTVNSTPSLQ